MSQRMEVVWLTVLFAFGSVNVGSRLSQSNVKVVESVRVACGAGKASQ